MQDYRILHELIRHTSYISNIQPTWQDALHSSWTKNSLLLSFCRPFPVHRSVSDCSSVPWLSVILHRVLLPGERKDLTASYISPVFKMESVSDQVRKLAANASPAERKQILNTLDDLHQEVEAPESARFRLQTRACEPPFPLPPPLEVSMSYTEC